MENENNSLEDKISDSKTGYKFPQEEKIAEMLDSYGIFYLYKQPAVVQSEGENKIIKPSFTLPQYGCSVIDYTPNYDKAGLSEKIQLYRYNQIPATVIGPPDIERQAWDKILYNQIKQTAENYFKTDDYKD
jgi:hypothetical protein